MIRVTLDTNEYVSALINGRKALRLLDLALDGEIEIAVSGPIIDETLRVVREKFKWSPYDVHAAHQRLLRIGRLIVPRTKLTITDDEPDNRILECAGESASQFLVTEDRDLLHLRQYESIRIVTATEFLSRIRGEAAGV